MRRWRWMQGPGQTRIKRAAERLRAATRRPRSGRNAQQRTGAGTARTPADRALPGPPHPRAASPACGHRRPGLGRRRRTDGCVFQIRSGQEGAVPQLCAVSHPRRDSGQPAHARLEPARAAPQGPRGRRGNPRADGARRAMRRARPKWPPRWASAWRSISSCWAI